MTNLQQATHHTRTAIHQYEQAQILFAYHKSLEQKHEYSRAINASVEAKRYTEDANWHNQQAQRYYSK